MLASSLTINRSVAQFSKNLTRPLSDFYQKEKGIPSIPKNPVKKDQNFLLHPVNANSNFRIDIKFVPIENIK